MKQINANTPYLLAAMSLLLCGAVAPVFALNDVPGEFQKCSSDADCTLYLDACHSCADFFAVRKDYQEKLRTFDYAQRTTEGNLRACESCNLKAFGVQAVCERGMCAAITNNGSGQKTDK